MRSFRVHFDVRQKNSTLIVDLQSNVTSDTHIERLDTLNYEEASLSTGRLT